MKEITAMYKGKEITFQRLDNTDIHKLIKIALAKIEEFKPTCLIGIKRGGEPVADIISKEIGLPVHTIHFTRYKGVQKTGGIDIKKELNFDLDSDSKILLADDVSDGGDTLIAAIDYLVNKKGVPRENIKTLTLHQKPWTKFKPDFIGEETKKWIIYPWEWEVEETKRDLIGEIPEEQFNILFGD